MFDPTPADGDAGRFLPGDNGDAMGAANNRFGSLCDRRRSARSRHWPRPLLNHFICAQEQRLRDRDAERLCGLHVDAELELRRPLDR